MGKVNTKARNLPERPAFHDPDDPMWVVGCIDSYGAITARVASGGGSCMHNKEESRGKRWRWNIWGQEYHATAMLDRLSDEELIAVTEWLTRRGYVYAEKKPAPAKDKK